jgi:hypothetical protein
MKVLADTSWSLVGDVPTSTLGTVQSHSLSSWGCRPELDDVRAFRCYNILLRHLAQAGQFAVFVLTIAVASTFIGFLYAGNFENVIFWDGTDHTCVLDGNTGHIDSDR